MTHRLEEGDEGPRKRIRLDDTSEAPKVLDDYEKEIRSGIKSFVNSDVPGFSGVLKQR